MGNKNEGYLGGIMGGESRFESGGGLKNTGILSLEEAGTQVVTPSNTVNASGLSLTDGLTLVSGSEVDHIGTGGLNGYEDAYITLPTGSGYVYAEVHMFAANETFLHQAVGLIKSASVDTNDFGHTAQANAVTVRRSSTSHYRHVGGSTLVPQTVSGRDAVNTYHFLVNRDNGNVWIGITPDGSTTRWIRSDDTMNATWSASHPTFVGLNLSTYDTFYFQQYYTTQSAWVNFGGNPLFNGQLSSGNDSGTWFRDPDASVSAASLGSEAATGPAETLTLPQLSWGGITGRSVLTEGSAAVPGDDNWNDVVLLMDGTSLTDDKSSANQTVTETGTDTALSNEVDPFGNTVDVLDFNRVGTGTSAISGIQVANSPITFGSNPFTIEMWVKLDAIGVNAQYFYSDRNSTDTFVLFRVETDGKLRFFRSVVGGVQGSFSGATALSADTWYHVALTYDGSTLRMFVDGNLDASSNQTVTFNSSTNPVLGYDPSSASSDAGYYSGQLTGQMAQVRVTKGVARYTSNFTPPTESFPTNAPSGTPGDDNWNDVTLLLDGSSATTDLSSAGNDTTDEGASISSATGPFGQDALDFDRTGSTATTGNYIETGVTDDFKFGTSPFTIEMWLKPDTLNTSSQTGGLACILDYGWDATGSLTDAWFALHQTNDEELWFIIDSANIGVTTSSSGLSTTSWSHVAIVRDATNTVTIYVDGVSKGSGSFNFNLSDALNRPLTIGKQPGQARHYDGQIADIRITKGVARYTSNFTPPTESFPTSLLGTSATPGTLVDTGIFTLEEIYELNKSA